MFVETVSESEGALLAPVKLTLISVTPTVVSVAAVMVKVVTEVVEPSGTSTEAGLKVIPVALGVSVKPGFSQGGSSSTKYTSDEASPPATIEVAALNCIVLVVMALAQGSGVRRRAVEREWKD